MVLNAVQNAAKRKKKSINMQIASYAQSPILHQKQLSRESIFCRHSSHSVTKMALTMLKNLLKTLHLHPYTTAHCLHKPPKNKPFAGLAKAARPRCVAITPITSAAKRRTNQTYLPLIIHQWGRTRPTPSGGQSSLKLTT